MKCNIKYRDLVSDVHLSIGANPEWCISISDVHLFIGANTEWCISISDVHLSIGANLEWCISISDVHLSIGANPEWCISIRRVKGIHKITNESKKLSAFADLLRSKGGRHVNWDVCVLKHSDMF